MENNISVLLFISIVIAAIGAINWGLVGLLDFDLIAYLFGFKTIASRIVYILIAFAGVGAVVLYLINNASELQE